MHTEVRIVAVTPRVCIISLIKRPVVNYSAYTTVATPQDIDQILYFKAFIWFCYLNCNCDLISVANSKTSF